MNSVVLSGRLTATPEVFNSGSDNAVAKFNLAVDRQVKKGEKETDFFTIVSFGKKAEFAANYLKKGTAVIVNGRLSQSSYTERETGKKRYSVEIVADSLEFQLGNSKPETQAQPQPVAAPPQPQAQPMPQQGYYVPQQPQAQPMPQQGYYVPPQPQAQAQQPTQAVPVEPSQAFVPMTGGAVFH